MGENSDAGKLDEVEVLEEVIEWRKANHINPTEFNRLKGQVLKKRGVTPEVSRIRKLLVMLNDRHITPDEFQTLKSRTLSGS
jgi:hypothetical protein